MYNQYLGLLLPPPLQRASVCVVSSMCCLLCVCCCCFSSGCLRLLCVTTWLCACFAPLEPASVEDRVGGVHQHVMMPGRFAWLVLMSDGVVLHGSSPWSFVLCSILGCWFKFVRELFLAAECTHSLQPASYQPHRTSHVVEHIHT